MLRHLGIPSPSMLVTLTSTGGHLWTMISRKGGQGKQYLAPHQEQVGNEIHTISDNRWSIFISRSRVLTRLFDFFFFSLNADFVLVSIYRIDNNPNPSSLLLRYYQFRESFAVLSLCNSEIGAPRILFTQYTIDYIFQVIIRSLREVVFGRVKLFCS